MDTALQPVEAGEAQEATPAVTQDRPATSILDLVAPGTVNSVEGLRELLEMQRQERAEQAEQAFNAAMAQASEEFPPVIKTRQVRDKHGAHRYSFEDLADVLNAVRPVLSRHGIHVRWAIECAEQTMTVTCIAAHRNGHYERSSMSARIEGPHGTNAVQAAASTKTALQRHTLKALCGLAAENEDDDGAGGKPQDAYDLARALDRIRAAATSDELNVLRDEIKNGAGPSFGQIPRDLVPGLVTAWKARRGELENVE